MPRIARMIIPDQKTVYHVMSRTALDGFPFGDVEKDELVKIIYHLSRVYFSEILGFCIMGNHFHLLVRTIPDHYFSDDEMKKRYMLFYGNDQEFSLQKIATLRDKWASLSEFVKEIKQSFSRYYNRRHHRRGTLWGERFKSLIVENGETLINCLAYIDLNTFRAGLVQRPENYRWNSIGCHMQTNNRDNFLSTDFGLKEFNVKSIKERIKRYRRYVYEAGAISRPDKMQAKVIGDRILKKERKREFKLSRSDRFRYRTRYFTDSGVIGSKEFVSKTYMHFKHHFNSKHEKKPKPVKGLSCVYSLKRLSEAI